MAFQKGLGCVHCLSHSLGGVNPRLHHGTLNAVFLPAVIALQCRGRIRAEGAAPAAHGPRHGPAVRRRRHLPSAIKAMNARLGLPSGLAAMGVQPDPVPQVIEGALADHCHKTNPRLASADDYEAMLKASM